MCKVFFNKNKGEKGETPFKAGERRFFIIDMGVPIWLGHSDSTII